MSGHLIFTSLFSNLVFEKSSKLSIEKSIIDDASIISFTHFIPTQHPDLLDNSIPKTQKSNNSLTLEGDNIGIIASTKANSL